MGATEGMDARKRIEALLDDNSFVEIGAYVKARNTDFNMPLKDTVSDGVITGYGVIGNRLVYVYSQDSSVLGGSVGEMHAKKILHLYDLAMKMGAPIIGLLDSTGLRIQESIDALSALGKIYQKQAIASGVVPQIAAVFGNCGGGLSVIANLSDFTFMEDTRARLFVNPPNVINDNKTLDIASSVFQAREAGNVDFTGSEAQILNQIRTLISILPANNEEEAVNFETDDDLNRPTEGLETQAEDVRRMVEHISDAGFVLESRKNYAPEMFTAFIRLNGATIGVVANRTKVYDDAMKLCAEFEARLSAKGCKKAKEFVKFCDAYNIPILTITNIHGYVTTEFQEINGATEVAGLICAFADATVPKVTLIAKEAIGTASLVMNARAIGSDVVYAWKNAKVGIMNADAAAKIIYAKELESGMVDLTSKAAEYEALQGNIMNVAARGYIDSFIEPVDTRKYIIGAFEMLYTKCEDRPGKKHGTI